jgi:hypothetical protein
VELLKIFSGSEMLFGKQNSSVNRIISEFEHFQMPYSRQILFGKQHYLNGRISFRL